jgi:hypothetical protein
MYFAKFLFRITSQMRCCNAHFPCVVVRLGALRSDPGTKACGIVISILNYSSKVLF